MVYLNFQKTLKYLLKLKAKHKAKKKEQKKQKKIACFQKKIITLSLITILP